MSMSKEAYLKQITTENPSVVGMLKSGYYEVVECDCSSITAVGGSLASVKLMFGKTSSSTILNW